MSNYTLPPEVLADPAEVIRLRAQLNDIKVAGPWQMGDDDHEWYRTYADGNGLGTVLCAVRPVQTWDAGEPVDAHIAIQMHIYGYGGSRPFTVLKVPTDIWKLLQPDPDDLTVAADVLQAKNEADKCLRERGWLLL